MSGERDRAAREQWRAELAPTPECLRFERLGEEWTAVEREHVEHCARCEAEAALFRELHDDAPSADEGAAVRWIAAEVRRRGEATPSRTASSPWWSWLAVPRLLTVAGTAVLAVAAIGLIRQYRVPGIDPSAGGAENYRSARLAVLAPLGDLAAPPADLTWRSVAGASTYEVEVSEVDQTVLWRVSVRETRAVLPQAVAAACVPGKTIFWRVTARSGAGVLAESGTQRFRVSIGPHKEK